MPTYVFCFIQDIITKSTDQAYSQSKFTNEQIETFKESIKSSLSVFEGIGIVNPFTSSSIIPETQSTPSTSSITSHSSSSNATDLANNSDSSTASDSARNNEHNVPTYSQTLNTLLELHSSSNSNQTIITLLSELQSSFISQIKEAVHKQVSEEMVKHLGINKNLTSIEVNQVLNKLGYTYKSILKKQNQILLLKTHIENGTTPAELSHYKFPTPFMAFHHKPIFVKNYNKIIEVAQKSIMELEIQEFELDITSLENDVRVHNKESEIIKFSFFF